MLKRVKITALLMSVLLIMAGCGAANDDGGKADKSGGKTETKTDASGGAKTNNAKAETDAADEDKAGPTMSMNGEELSIENIVDAVITLESGDEIRLELYPGLAPKTVDNFVKLAKEGFYEGTIFHRVVNGFMIQGGGYGEEFYDKNFDGREAESIEGEFRNNGFEGNVLSHTPGVISMARTSDPNSASSQFFIVHGSAVFLDGDYAAFGKVKDDESMAVVNKIANVEVEDLSREGYPSEAVPVEPIVIKSVEIVEPADVAEPESGAETEPAAE